MEPFLVGIASLILIVVLIYAGCYVAVALSFVSFLGVWFIKIDATIAMRMMTLAVTDSIKSYDFASIPTFVMMGMIVGKAGFGADVYAVANQLFRRVRGGLGMATVGANAVFAAVTGSSIASASVFAKVSVPQMLRFDYGPRFAVGVVAGSSVLGMIIPPSAMLIIYSFVAEQSVAEMFLAGVVPGLLLAFAFILAIMFMGRFFPAFVGGTAPDMDGLPWRAILVKTGPIMLLIAVVLGGIYTGWLTAVEAGAAGSLTAL